MASKLRNRMRPVFSRLEAAGFWCVRTILSLRGRDITDSIPGDQVLVIAPHQDDETLGAGVTIMRLVEAGKVVHVCVVTDGRNSHTSSVITRDKLAEIRHDEMVEACRRLGVPRERVHFGPCEDRFVGDQVDKAEAFLRGLVNTICPTLVISPSGIDRHYDHHAIALIVARLSAQGVINCPVYEYPIWFYSIRSWVNLDRITPGMLLGAIWKPLRAAFTLPVVLVGSKGYLDRKREALDAHRSQMVNLTGESTWLTLPQAWLKSFFTGCEMFFPLRVEAEKRRRVGSSDQTAVPPLVQADTGTRPIRVVHTMPNLIVGGGQHLLLRNIKGFDPTRVHSIVCCTDALGDMEPAYRAAGISVTCLHRGKGALSLLWAARRLARLVRWERVDVIHTNNTVADRTVGQIAALLTRRPVVNSLHSEHLRTEEIKGWKSMPRRIARRLGVALARCTVDHVIPVSQSVKESWEPYLRSMGVKPESITVVNPGLASERFERPSEHQRLALKKELGIENAWPVLINVGRLNYHKGQHWLIPMMKPVLELHPGARLILVGDGQDRDVLTEAIRSQGVQDSVTMLGQRGDITQLLSIADLFVFPSLTEGFPLAVLEAMAAGLPIVAFGLPSFRGCVEDGQSASLVPVGDDRAFTRAVLKILNDREQMTELGRSARSVAARFTQESTSSAIDQVYRSLSAQEEKRGRGMATA